MLNKNNNSYAVRVYYEDTDAGGIVYYANYLKFFERARTEWLRQIGVMQSTYLEQNLAFVVTKVAMDNVASARLDDLLTVTSIISQLKRASLVFEQHITNHNNQLLCKAEIKVASVNLDSGKPCAIPLPILGAFQRVI